MKTYTSTVHVDAPPEIAFACVVDPDVMTAGGGFRFTVLEQTNDGIGTRIRYETRLLGLRLGGTLTFTEYVPNEMVTLHWHGTERYVLGGLRGRWSFTAEDGGTTITVRSEFERHVPVLHALAAWVTIRSFRTRELSALKAQIEARAARPVT
jgi:ligand-binding SRPBCC domain-containing protein